MKTAILSLTLIMLTGCTSVFQDPNTVGYRDYDPCIRCGEGWIFLPNPGYGDQLAKWRREHGVSR